MTEGTTVFIGGLSDRARDKDIEDFFDKYGKVTQIRLRDRYGFVDFDDRRDAEEWFIIITLLVKNLALATCHKKQAGGQSFLIPDSGILRLRT